MGQAEMTALGLMSGTSMDGIDVAVIRTDGERIGEAPPPLGGAWATYAYAPALSARLAAVVRHGNQSAAADLSALEAALTDAHAVVVEQFLAEHGAPAGAIDVVGFHGHTVLHRPERRLTLQIGDGARLAARLGIDVVSDFRSADVAAGGQGAPLASLYHAALAHGLEQPLAVLNLGGVGNVTYIDGDTLLAFDTGPGNALINDWVAHHTGRPYDAEGQLAAAGRVDGGRLMRLLAAPFFDRPPPKSLDRNDFDLGAVDGLSDADGARTLAAFTAAAVARALDHLPSAPKRWLVTGGGRHNPVIMAELRARLGAPVDPVEAVGWIGDALEAQAFAFLAVRTLQGLPISLPGTTGAPQPLTGGTAHRAPRREPSAEGAP
jgi:anhydro-N-acetylmuramic acid kinase